MYNKNNTILQCTEHANKFNEKYVETDKFIKIFLIFLKGYFFDLINSFFFFSETRKMI